MSHSRKPADATTACTGCCSCRPADRDFAPSESGAATKHEVRKQYGALIKDAAVSTGCCADRSLAAIAGYTDEQLQTVPENLRHTTFACGNPVAFAALEPGQVVLDIGSGAGLDAMLAARKVGPTGKVIGLDMTPEMIATARANARQAGLHNIEFRLGDAEAMPVADNSCDWIISNCVINLAPDKAQVFSEAFRVLKPGGTLMVSDIVTHGLPPALRNSMAAWISCLGGAMEQEEYLQKIRDAGFEAVEITARLIYDGHALNAVAGSCCLPEATNEIKSALAELGPQVDGRVSSVRVSAVKPMRK